MWMLAGDQLPLTRERLVRMLILMSYMMRVSGFQFGEYGIRRDVRFRLAADAGQRQCNHEKDCGGEVFHGCVDNYAREDRNDNCQF